MITNSKVVNIYKIFFERNGQINYLPIAETSEKNAYTVFHKNKYRGWIKSEEIILKDGYRVIEEEKLWLLLQRRVFNFLGIEIWKSIPNKYCLKHSNTDLLLFSTDIKINFSVTTKIITA